MRSTRYHLLVPLLYPIGVRRLFWAIITTLIAYAFGGTCIALNVLFSEGICDTVKNMNIAVAAVSMGAILCALIQNILLYLGLKWTAVFPWYGAWILEAAAVALGVVDFAVLGTDLDCLDTDRVVGIWALTIGPLSITAALVALVVVVFGGWMWCSHYVSINHQQQGLP